ncbi:hypothetical protein, partial [Streptococcus thermophilus]|uniref:hypothetical protein n=4 Tax=Streptococcus thermophilus TaxID=1308 RepID=UPI0021A7ABED
VLPNDGFVALHYSSYGTFCVYLKSSIISTVVLPTTEIIEPIFQKICEKLLKLFQQLCKMVITNSDYSENLF